MIHVPTFFAEQDEGKLFSLIESNSFATLVTGTGQGLWVSHLPFLLDRRRKVLRAHMARANPHWQAFVGATETLAIFQGPHHYVSPAWYGHHPSVPTWNYATVHVRGTPHLLQTSEELEQLLADLVADAEGDPPGWTMALERSYLDTMLAAIVGFEIPINSMTGKFKLSQNRPVADRPRVIAALERAGSDAAQAVAALMRAGLDDRVS
jgi:transcriptional regulator